jgi:hypothetical protein
MDFNIRAIDLKTIYEDKDRQETLIRASETE